MENNKNKGITLKFLSYGIFIFSVFILQNTPHFLEFWGIKPNIIYVVAVVLAMFEGEFSGGILGMIIGMLCDYSSYPIHGFNAMLLLICCTMIGLAVIYFMKNNKLNAFTFSAIALSLRGFLEYYFVYVIWKYENTSIILFKHIIPTIIYSLLFVIPIFFVISKIHKYFNEKYNLEQEI